jgi:alanine dehydrogenase
MDDGETTRFLTSSDVADLAGPADYVSAVRDGFRDRGEGAPAEPRTALFNDAPPGMLTGYLAILPSLGTMGGYTYAAGFGEQDAHFILPLYDAESGRPLAVFDGASLNPFKTGAAGAVAVDALARTDASTVGLLGSGAQARGQLQSVATVRDLEAVSVYSPTAAHRTEFAAEMDAMLDATVEPVSAATDAVADADIVITATNADEPVFDGTDLESGTHVTAMGQYHPHKREVDDRTVARATYVPDLTARLDQDAGAYIHARDAGVIEPDHLHAELGDVIAGSVPGRTAPEEITLFDSGGTAIETVAAATMLYEKALAADRGEEIQFAPASEALTGR